MLVDVVEARSLLSSLPSAMAHLDVTGLDESDLCAVLAEVRSAQRSLDGVMLRIAARADALASVGCGAPVEETVCGGGMVSSRQAKREAGRAKTAQAMPRLEEAVGTGEISAEHVDVVSRQTAKLTEAQLDHIDQSALVEQAASLPVETFDRLVRRQVTSMQWAALKAMHTSCAWDSCTAPISWCQAHHIREWEHGGSTDLDNLVPLCSRHHHLVHEGRWSVRLLVDRTLKIYRPHGELHTTVSPPMRC